MDKKLFESEMHRARAMQSKDNDYWTGYQRGIRQRYHGEDFGDPGDHEKWMALADEDRDHARRDRGLGYRAGYLGPQLSADHATSSYGIPVIVHAGDVMDYGPGIRLIRQWRGWSCEDLAGRIDASPRTIEGWEQGRMPSAEALLKLQFTINNEEG